MRGEKPTGDEYVHSFKRPNISSSKRRRQSGCHPQGWRIAGDFWLRSA
jgi:hypothetical protein